MPTHPSSLQAFPTPQPSRDGWLGSRDFPGYRAGSVVARLGNLSQVYPEHLYLHLVLLDAKGDYQDDRSGPCYSLTRERPPEDRARFVRVAAELFRHAPSDDRGLGSIGQAIGVFRDQGLEQVRLAAQLLDQACSESAVVASLTDLLDLSLGADEAARSMGEVVQSLVGEFGPGAFDCLGLDTPAAELVARVRAVDCGLSTQVSFVVAVVGKAHAREFLRKVIRFDLVPTPQLLSV